MTPKKPSGMSAAELDRTLERLTDEIVGQHRNLDQTILVGIRTGGAFLAQRLADRIGQRTGKPMRVGVLDITLYRDDWTQLSHKPLVGKTELPGSIDDQEVVLVDDVLFTGRTIRAALDALIDYGRPRRIELAVLIDRGGRELPKSSRISWAKPSSFPRGSGSTSIFPRWAGLMRWPSRRGRRKGRNLSFEFRVLSFEPRMSGGHRGPRGGSLAPCRSKVH